ncbi:transcriptional regulator of LuxR family protein [Psychromonas ingrahamii 37]|uniref:Transcriptional regulator of LuxR family protein n=1 Tax=Psychromonas ingrahamii (strain DSM 17664 / CCUG 51855 / 37) TaxID=357804 RepID=A1SU61_PSYIN|nr:UvrY/SirA/GacA family response regulator transcription factor [Psychromonas ingrahamii]ABM03026.1 transcriptional regulator of LuxR family protein [Psychromonas ingrahamii 37]
MINILLVDDHELVRTGICRIIDDVRGMKVIGEAQSGEEAVKWCRKNHPDVVLMDINMPGMGGLDAMHKILRINEDLKIIMLTMHTENPFPSKVMQAGASGYISKSAGPDEVLNAIRLVHSGQRYLAPEIAQKIALSQLSPTADDPFSVLSERELQIMMMITKGQRVVDISEQLGLSPKTINSYRYRLFDKLDVKGDVGLTHLAIRYGMLDTAML